jgi:hypothetical protein
VADAAPDRAELDQVDADPAVGQRDREHAAGYPAPDDQGRRHAHGVLLLAFAVLVTTGFFLAVLFMAGSS